MKDEERKSVIDYRSMFIDIGALNKEEAINMGIEIGSPISFPTQFKRMGEEK